MLSITIVSFPGLGIGETEIDNMAFDLFELLNIEGSFPVYWYGIVITLGIVLAFVYASFRAKYERIKFDDLIDVELWTVIIGVIGARLYYVLTTLENYIPKPFNLGQFIKNVFNLRQGGLAIYGGIIGALTGGIIVAKIQKMKVLPVLDITMMGFLLGQGIGRWGNFMNQEAYGSVTDLPWAMMSEGTGNMLVHPCFLYESLWCLTGFVLLHFYGKYKPLTENPFPDRK